ncbi:MAG: hypothetical protein B7X02_01440, partial [Rhodospirillales bacterium 12-54-5]
KQGATMIESVADILSNLSPIGELPLAEQDAFNFHEPAIAQPDEDELNSARDAILAVLSFSPTLVDDILTASQAAPNLMMVVLLELELAGRIERHAGGRISLRAQM